MAVSEIVGLPVEFRPAGDAPVGISVLESPKASLPAEFEPASELGDEGNSVRAHVPPSLLVSGFTATWPDEELPPRTGAVVLEG